MFSICQGPGLYAPSQSGKRLNMIIESKMVKFGNRLPQKSIFFVYEAALAVSERQALLSFQGGSEKYLHLRKGANLVWLILMRHYVNHCELKIARSKRFTFLSPFKSADGIGSASRK